MTRRSLPLLGGLLLALAILIARAVPAPAAGDPSFSLVNRADAAVRALYVTPSGDPNWGEDRLAGGPPIPPGGSFPVRRRADGRCRMDIRVVFADGRSEERRGLDTCTLDAVTVGGPEQMAPKAADDPSFRLINRGATALRAFYAIPSGGTGWGTSRLPPGGLPAGTATVVHLPRGNGCRFDLRAVFDDRRTLEQHRIDLCRITDVPVP
jgi:hypothetical protein